ncbi:MAG: hypothetical protein ACK5PF_10800 [bacterium]
MMDWLQIVAMNIAQMIGAPVRVGPLTGRDTLPAPVADTRGGQCASADGDEEFFVCAVATGDEFFDHGAATGWLIDDHDLASENPPCSGEPDSSSLSPTFFMDNPAWFDFDY